MSNIEVVGRVRSLNIYPVKGMQGIAMDELSLRSVSVVGDRVKSYSVVELNRGDKVVPMNRTPNALDTTMGTASGLLRYRTSLVTPENPRDSKIMVHTPSGKDLDADSDELMEEISQLIGGKLSKIRLGRGEYHSMPVSLLSYESIRALEASIGLPIDPRRFRENILIETESGKAFEEDTWIGKKILSFGEKEDGATIAIVKQDSRCATVNMDPITGDQAPKILRTIVNERDNKFGVYGTIFIEGKIRVGDVIYAAPLPQLRPTA